MAQRTKDILCITVTANFSAMYDSAQVAKELARGSLSGIRIEVLDCRTAAGAQGLVVLSAARAAALGASLPQVIEQARQTMAKVHLVAFLDTLYYLAKGGRGPKVAVWAGSTLHIKPLFQILSLSDEATPLERARGKRQAMQCLVDIVQERTRDKGEVHAIVLHTNVPQEAQSLQELLPSLLPCAAIYVKDFTPVMGAHTGPGLLGVAFYAEEVVSSAQNGNRHHRAVPERKDHHF